MAWICNICHEPNSQNDSICKHCGQGERPEVAIVDKEESENSLGEEEK